MFGQAALRNYTTITFSGLFAFCSGVNNKVDSFINIVMVCLHIQQSECSVFGMNTGRVFRILGL